VLAVNSSGATVARLRNGRVQEFVKLPDEPGSDSGSVPGLRRPSITRWSDGGPGRSQAADTCRAQTSVAGVPPAGQDDGKEQPGRSRRRPLSRARAPSTAQGALWRNSEEFACVGCGLALLRVGPPPPRANFVGAFGLPGAIFEAPAGKALGAMADETIAACLEAAAAFRSDRRDRTRSMGGCSPKRTFAADSGRPRYPPKRCELDRSSALAVLQGRRHLWADPHWRCRLAAAPADRARPNADAFAAHLAGCVTDHVSGKCPGHRRRGESAARSRRGGNRAVLGATVIDIVYRRPTVHGPARCAGRPCCCPSTRSGRKRLSAPIFRAATG